MEDLITEVKQFYGAHEMGELVVYSLHPVTLIIRDEYDCSKNPDVGKTLCLLNEGILEAVFEAKLGMPLRVVEKDTFGTGFNMCKYVIAPFVVTAGTTGGAGAGSCCVMQCMPPYP